jgi:hypothetical protein
MRHPLPGGIRELCHLKLIRVDDDVERVVLVRVAHHQRLLLHDVQAVDRVDLAAKLPHEFEGRVELDRPSRTICRRHPSR